MSSCREIEIPVPWGHIAGKWWGPHDVQPVLGLHGWQDNAGTFDRLAPLLPSNISLLCIDMPGHGLSSHYPAGQYYYLFWDGVLLVRRIAKHFNWKKISIMGHSLGGAIGFLYAASFPNEVDKLITIDIVSPSVRDVTKLVSDTGAVIDKFLKYETLSANDVPHYSYNEMLDIVEDAYKGSLTRESCEIMMNRGMLPNAKSDNTFHFCRDLRLKVAGMGFLSLDIILEYASRITCEVLNIKGNPGMHKNQQEYYYHLVLNKIKETARRFEFYEVEGTHHLHLNTPENVCPYIATFLVDPPLTTSLSPNKLQRKTQAL